MWSQLQTSVWLLRWLLWIWRGLLLVLRLDGIALGLFALAPFGLLGMLAGNLGRRNVGRWVGCSAGGGWFLRSSGESLALSAASETTPSFTSTSFSFLTMI